MQIQHDGETVLTQAVLTHQFRQILNPEDVITGADGGNLVELLFNQGSRQELEGFRTGEAAVGKEHGDLSRTLALFQMASGECRETGDVLHQVPIAERSLSEKVHEPLRSSASPDVKETARHHLFCLLNILRQDIGVRRHGEMGPRIVLGEIEFSCKLRRCGQHLSRTHSSRLTCRISHRR